MPCWSRHRQDILIVLCRLPALQHHAASTSHIATALSKDEQIIIAARAAASPLFVLPLAKKPGSFQTLLLQWQPHNRLLFTTVDEFKQWGPQAPPHLTVQLFDDLAGSHGLVLLRGDLIKPGLINAAEVRAVLTSRGQQRNCAVSRFTSPVSLQLHRLSRP